MLYSIRYEQAENSEKTGLEAKVDFIAALAFALVVCHVLLLSAWSDVRALLRAAWGVLAVLALFGRLWLVRKIDSIK